MTKCECGGKYKESVVKDFDFTPFAGLPVILQEGPGLRCSKCGDETLDGKVIDGLLDALASEVIKQPHLLNGQQARFLRKRLGLTQGELAERMGLSRRETVADWERGNISPQNDYILRALTFDRLSFQQSSFSQLRGAIERVQTSHFKGTPPPFVIKNALERLRDNGHRRK